MFGLENFDEMSTHLRFVRSYPVPNKTKTHHQVPRMYEIQTILMLQFFLLEGYRFVWACGGRWWSRRRAYYSRCTPNMLQFHRQALHKCGYIPQK